MNFASKLEDNKRKKNLYCKNRENEIQVNGAREDQLFLRLDNPSGRWYHNALNNTYVRTGIFIARMEKISAGQ